MCATKELPLFFFWNRPCNSLGTLVGCVYKLASHVYTNMVTKHFLSTQDLEVKTLHGRTDSMLCAH